METVRQIIHRSQAELAVVEPDATVLEALQLMATRNVGSVLVVQAGKLCGIVTERDYARKVVLEGRQSANTPVSDVMSTEVVHVLPEQTVDDCMGIMTRRKIRHLPVMENEQLVGLVSIGDLVKSTIADQEHTIEELTRYINN